MLSHPPHLSPGGSPLGTLPWRRMLQHLVRRAKDEEDATAPQAETHIISYLKGTIRSPHGHTRPELLGPNTRSNTLPGDEASSKGATPEHNVSMSSSRGCPEATFRPTCSHGSRRAREQHAIRSLRGIGYLRAGVRARGQHAQWSVDLPRRTCRKLRGALASDDCTSPSGSTTTGSLAYTDTTCGPATRSSLAR